MRVRTNPKRWEVRAAASRRGTSPPINHQEGPTPAQNLRHDCRIWEATPVSCDAGPADPGGSNAVGEIA
jgi:hypothetical protein